MTAEAPVTAPRKTRAAKTAPAAVLTGTPADLTAEEPLGLLLTYSTKDLKEAAVKLTPAEARYLVDFYYSIQEYRIRSAGQVRSGAEGEPNALLSFVYGEFAIVEKRIKLALEAYTDTLPIGLWLKANHGIGPVIAAGLLAHIDITKAPTAGHIWSFAGLDPKQEWKKGEKRPWNARLKVLSWKASQSFVKFKASEKCFYGHVYAIRKGKEVARNEAGDFAQQAADILTKKKIGKETDAYAAYSQGKLPPAHIQARACRYASKMFLAHLQLVWYFAHYGEMPVRPYVIEHMGHVDFIPPPHLDVIPGLKEAIIRQYPGVSFAPPPVPAGKDAEPETLPGESD